MPRRTQLAAVAVTAVVAVACGGDTVEIPELTAEPLPPAPEPESEPPADGRPDAAGGPQNAPAPDVDVAGDWHDTGEGSEPADDPEPAPADDPTEAFDPVPEPPGPSDRDVGAFLTGLATEAVDRDHVVGDLTGDGRRDLLLAALDPDGALAVLVATWAGDEFRVTGELVRDAVDRLGRTTLKDLTADGRREVLVPFRSGPRLAVLVATVADDGVLATPPACPLTEPATVAIVLDAGAYEPELACSRRDTTGPTVLVWEDDVFQGPSGPFDAGGR